MEDPVGSVHASDGRHAAVVVAEGELHEPAIVHEPARPHPAPERKALLRQARANDQRLEGAEPRLDVPDAEDLRLADHAELLVLAARLTRRPCLPALRI